MLSTYMIPSYEVLDAGASASYQCRWESRLAPQSAYVTISRCRRAYLDGHQGQYRRRCCHGTREAAIAEGWAPPLDLPLSLVKHQHTFVPLGGAFIQAIRAISCLRLLWAAGCTVNTQEQLRISIAHLYNVYRTIVAHEIMTKRAAIDPGFLCTPLIRSFLVRNSLLLMHGQPVLGTNPRRSCPVN